MQNRVLLLIVFCLLSPLCLTAQDSVIETLNRFAQENQITTGAEYDKFWEQAVQAFQKGQSWEAAYAFGQASLLSPQHPLPSLYFAMSLFACEQYTAGGRTLRRTIPLYSDWSNLPLNVLKMFPSPADLSQRLARFESWLFAETRPADAYFLFALLCQFAGEPRKAEIAYRMLLKREPLYREAYPFLEMLLGKELGLSGPSLATLKADGLKALDDKQYPKAVATWLSACARYPQEGEAFYALGYSLAALGYFEDAAATLRAAIRHKPELLPLQWKAQQLFLQKDPGWLTTLEEYFQAQSSRSDLLFLLCYLYGVIGENKKAAIACKHLQQNNPGAKEIQVLGKLLEKSEQPLVPLPKEPQDKKPKSVEKDKKKE